MVYISKRLAEYDVSANLAAIANSDVVVNNGARANDHAMAYDYTITD